MTHHASAPTELSVDIIVIRADGTREDHGRVAYYHRNPLRRFWWSLTHRTKRG